MGYLKNGYEKANPSTHFFLLELIKRHRTLLPAALASVPFGFVLSPTHKRTEGRAPVWGSEFTTKVAQKGGF
jgi:hypothetical protein